MEYGFLDSIMYGNPTIEQLEFLSKESYLDSLLPELTTYTFPANSSEATKEELNEIVTYQKRVESRDDLIKRYKLWDCYLINSVQLLFPNNEDLAEESVKVMFDIIEETSSLLYKLKYYFQRPRPYQLARYYKLKLFPHDSPTANSPSFPSGHSFQAKLFAEVFGNQHPQTYNFLQKFVSDVSYSRISLGLHFQSDLDVGIFCAEKVIQLKEFKLKYGI